MAMTGAGLSAALKSALEGQYTVISEPELQRFCDAAGNAIVTYIQSNGAVNPINMFANDPEEGPLAITGLGIIE